MYIVPNIISKLYDRGDGWKASKPDGAPWGGL